MPNRIIRESCRFSESLNVLASDLGAEAFFWRLITVADDFGRFLAEPSVMLSTCFPCRPKTVKEVHVGKWMQMLANANIVKFYEKDGRQYGYFVAWTKHQGRPRAQQSKYPDPADSASICLQMQANVLVSESVSENRESKSNIVIGGSATPTPPTLWSQAEEVLNFLNEKAGRNYRARERGNQPTANLQFIKSRLESGASVEQCRALIAIKVRKWKDDPKMVEYLRPATLFGKEKFEQYIGEVGT